MIKENTFEFGGRIYHPMQMHCHSICEGHASMEGQMYQAASLGMRYIFITDHDHKKVPMSVNAHFFDFSVGSRGYENETQLGIGFAEPNGSVLPEVCEFTPGLLHMVHDDGTAAKNEGEEWSRSGVRFTASSGRERVPMFCGPILHLNLSCKLLSGVPEDCRLRISFQLSQRPPDTEQAHMHYVIGPSEGLDGPYSLVRTIAPSVDGYRNDDLVLDLPGDATGDEGLARLGGVDNCVILQQIFLETRNGASFSCDLSRYFYDIEERDPDAVNQRQQELADRIGAALGVTPFVRNEISMSGPHKNVFTPGIPIIRYPGYAQHTNAEAVRYVQSYRGVYSYNHPFMAFKRVPVLPEEHNAIVERIACELIATGMYGAQLTEVGFPEGRFNFSLAEHLKLWDLISMAGVFVTGYGDNDSHGINLGWRGKQNFCSWVAADAADPAPKTCVPFLDSMRAGRLLTGDPAALHGNISFETESGKPTGAVIRQSVCKPEDRRIRFTMDHPEDGWTFRMIRNGEVAAEQILDGSPFAMTYEAEESKKPVDVIRAEVYNADMRCVLLTNPIYYVMDSVFTGTIPAEREYPDI